EQCSRVASSAPLSPCALVLRVPSAMSLPFPTLLTLAQQAPSPRAAWAPVALMIVIALGFTIGNVVLSLLIGPSRTGAVKEQTYESGMTPIGDTRKRFNVRFYIVA